MQDQTTITTLNNLIEVSRDGEQGFRACAEGADDPTLKTYFLGCAARCAASIAQLGDLVRRFGGEPATSGSVAGALHRGWVNVKTAVTSKDDLAVLEECERGEDVAVKTYADALKESLPTDVYAVVHAQYQGVVSNHDRIKALRNERKRLSA